MLKLFFSRNFILYAIVALILAQSVDWNKCFKQRARYLLGIVYNGYFQNNMDGIVYNDYLKRHGTNHDAFKNTL
jgi:hypothetical protein